MSDNNDKLRSLERVLQEGEAVAFVGAGASFGVYSKWHELVGKIYGKCLGENCRPWAAMSEDELIDAAEEAKLANKAQYYEVIGAEFCSKPISRNAYRYLAQAPFRNYVTTNYDCLLANELAQLPENKGREGKIIFPYPEEISRALNDSKTVVHIHGYVASDLPPSDSRPIVLARSEYDTAYSNSSRLPNYLRLLLADHPVLFIGCSLREMPLRTVLEEARGIRQTGRCPPPLFILLASLPPPREGDPPSEQLEDDESRYYEEFGIQVVRFPFSHDHMRLDDILRGWTNIQIPKINSPKWKESVL